MKLLARASGRLGNLEASRSIYDRLGTDGLEAEDLYILGSILRRDGLHAESQELFLLGYERDADHEETIAELGRLYMGTDRLVEALADGAENSALAKAGRCADRRSKAFSASTWATCPARSARSRSRFGSIRP